LIAMTAAGIAVGSMMPLAADLPIMRST